MASNCSDCVYSGKIHSGVCCCYILKTGKMRPCEPGAACTVKIKYRRRNYPVKKPKKLPGEG